MAKKKWVQSAVKHEGVEIEKARRNGVSTREQLEKDSHSSDASVRARGNLGLRFEKGGDMHHGKSDEKPKRRLRDFYRSKKG